MSRALEHAFLSYAFRPMFLALGVFSVLSMALWIGALTGITAAAATLGPLWHGHEMLFGFALAAVAGFLLTAVATWTGRPPVHGMPLLLLVTAWLFGRLVLASGLPPSMGTATTAMLFPLLLTGLVAHEVVRGGSRRNYPIVALVSVLALLDGVFHAATLQGNAAAERFALLAALYVLTTLVSVIAGRIVPSFTANWLRSRGATRLPVERPWLERLVLPVTILTAVLALLLPDHPLTAGSAALAAVVHALRLSGWRGLSALSEPIVFILHVAYGWIPVGFALLSVAVASGALGVTAALHALGAGAIGVMILAVTTRVALGHTGRPLRAARTIVIAYVLLNVAVAARVAAPAAGSHYLTALEIAACGWIVAWSLFVLTYTPILLRARVSST